MANLKDLPHEIILQIISFTSRGELVALGRANKELHEISLPLLYRQIKFGQDDESKRKAGRQDGRFNTFALFVTTILLNPQIAAIVQSLSLGPSTQYFDLRASRLWRLLLKVRLPLQYQEFESIEDAVEDRLEDLFASTKLKSRWFEEICTLCQMSSIIAFGLSLLPGLRALKIEFKHQSIESKICQIIRCRRRRPALAQQLFSKLEYVCFRSSQPYLGLAHDDVPAEMVTLPSLRYLKTGIAEKPGPAFFQRAAVSGLRYINFQNAFRVSEPLLRQFVRNCQSLNHLEFHVDMCRPRRECDLMSATFVDLLAQYCPNLIGLSMRVPPCECDASEDDDRRRQGLSLPVDLRKLQKLRILRISLLFLFGHEDGVCQLVDQNTQTHRRQHDCRFAREFDEVKFPHEMRLLDTLPTSVRHVTFTDCHKSFDNAHVILDTFWELLQQKEARYPSLRSLSVVVNGDRLDHLPGEIGYDLLETELPFPVMAKKVGVELNQTHGPFESDPRGLLGLIEGHEKSWASGGMIP